ncbi:MAG: TonB-dependent receptor [Bacteroidia bacterium]|nr:TonB-dependent receptor [Bacteroidia bacterium]
MKNLAYIFIALFYALVFSVVSGFSQQTLLQGEVKDSENGEPLAGVSLGLKGTIISTSTDAAGQFMLSTTAEFPVTLVVSLAGYSRREVIVLDAAPLVLVMQPGELDAVVVSASRVEERLLSSAVSIEKMDLNAVRTTPAISYFDALQSLKSVDMATSSLVYKEINTRGFSNTGNSRFLQLTDGVDNQSAGLGWPVGHLFGPSDLDVESVELIPGSASALYGPIAFNGLLQTKTKDPFLYEGLSVQTKVGVNHLGASKQAAPLYGFAARYAKAFNNRFAFKVNASYFAGQDWHANDYTDVDPNTPLELRGPNNPGRNALNIYGDEVAQVLDSVGRVSRTGYEEIDLTDYEVYALKLSAALHYRLTDKLGLLYQLSYNQGTANYTGSSRFSLNDFSLTTHRVELRGNHFFVRAYGNLENSHNSYSTRSLGQQLNRTWVRDLNGQVVTPAQADATWFSRYAAAYAGNISGVAATDHGAARSFADEGRYLPGTPDYEREKKRLIQTPGLAGAGILSQSKLYHVDAQYDFSEKVGWAELLVGGNYRFYDMYTEGTLFDDLTDPVTVQEYGVFAQASKSLIGDKLRFTVSGRYDKNENFEGRFTPRASVVFSPVKNHNFRASYQSGFRNPTVGDLYIKLNVGPIIILGGAPANSEGLNAYENSVTAASVGPFFGAFQQALQQGNSPEEAVALAKDILVKSDVPYIKPEQNQTYEIGYKGMIGERFMADVNYYYSTYTDFIINQVVIRPNSPVLGDNGLINPAAVDDLLSGNTLAFQLYTNAADRVSTQGVSLGLTGFLAKGYRLHGNTTWSDFNILDANPNNIPAFNTPRWKTNLTLSNSKVTERIGFSIAWHWQESFEWYGTLNELRPGTIEAYHLLDAQVSYRVPPVKTIVKLGANNLTNRYIVQAYGSPAVGGLYYVALTFDELFQ